MKSVRIRSFSFPYFSACRLNTERYGVSVGMGKNTDQKDLIEVFLGKVVLKICSKCTEEHPYRAKESLPSSLLHVFIMGNSVCKNWGSKSRIGRPELLHKKGCKNVQLCKTHRKTPASEAFFDKVGDWRFLETIQPKHCGNSAVA